MKSQNLQTSTEYLTLIKLTLPELKNELIECPQLLAKPSCGLFGISDDFIEKYQSLDQLFIKNKFSTFFFECIGDSMEPTIKSGQILIVDRSINDFHGKVCVVTYEDKLICKRVYIRKDGILLKSDNHQFKDVLVNNQDSSFFWGVVVGVAGFVK